jgi:hypothetical protein
MTQRLLFLILFIPTITSGQHKLNEKFINDSFNENNYLIFNPDSTFKYRLAYHLFHDISCGHYKVIKDTIFLFYESDIRDTFCNKEIDVTNFDSSSLALRPTKLFYSDDKLYKIENGKVVNRTEGFQPDNTVFLFSLVHFRTRTILNSPAISKN